jgi:hypothetical protein
MSSLNGVVRFLESVNAKVNHYLYLHKFAYFRPRRTSGRGLPNEIGKYSAKNDRASFFSSDIFANPFQKDMSLVNNLELFCLTLLDIRTAWIVECGHRYT